MPSIRPANHLDREVIRTLYLRAFPTSESARVATLAVELLDTAANPGAFALIAETDAACRGHIAYSPVTLQGKCSWRGFILAPLAVHPDFRQRGIGSSLVKAGLARISQSGSDAVFVYGDPAYYHRFGFATEEASHFTPPHKPAHPHGWQRLPVARQPMLRGPVPVRVAPAVDNSARG